MRATRFPPRRFLLAAAVTAGLAALTAGTAFACDCDTHYDGDYYRYHHRDAGYGNYSCYGGGYDCRFEDASYRDRYRYDDRYYRDHGWHDYNRDRDYNRRW